MKEGNAQRGIEKGAVAGCCQPKEGAMETAFSSKAERKDAMNEGRGSFEGMSRRGKRRFEFLPRC